MSVAERRRRRREDRTFRRWLAQHESNQLRNERMVRSYADWVVAGAAIHGEAWETENQWEQVLLAS